MLVLRVVLTDGAGVVGVGVDGALHEHVVRRDGRARHRRPWSRSAGWRRPRRPARECKSEGSEDERRRSKHSTGFSPDHTYLHPETPGIIQSPHAVRPLHLHRPVNRTVLLLSLLSTLGALTIACGDSPSTLEGRAPCRSAGRSRAMTQGRRDKTSTTDKTDPAPAKSRHEPAEHAPGRDDLGEHGGVRSERSQDCGRVHEVLRGRPRPRRRRRRATARAARAASAPMRAGDNLCGGKSPELPECGICLFQAKCDLGDLGAGLGGGAASGSGDSAACFQICEDKP